MKKINVKILLRFSFDLSNRILLNQTVTLKQILIDMKNQLQTSEIFAVFDLDSTLFDVNPRIHRIIWDFANNNEYQKKFPDSCEVLKKFETKPTDWGIREALIRAGLDGHHPSFHESIKNFWKENFFSNKYLHLDIPYPGAVEFVKKIFDLGAKVIYLTGRDIERMGDGTEMSLKHWQFPIDKNSLVLKPKKGLDDAQFKSDYFKTTFSTQSKNIWLFENEPTNIHLIRKEHPHIKIVFFESTHSGKHEPPQDLPKIINFLMD